MASALIHIAIANEINKKLKRKEKELLTGSIAPDIAKIIGNPKSTTHFLIGDTNIPNMDLFNELYGYFYDDDFTLGYYIHLYTDYVWFKYFIPDFFTDTENDGIVYLLNGEEKKATADEIVDYIYNDYTNINFNLIDKYNLNMELFYEEPCKVESIIRNYPYDRLQALLDKMGIIIENSTEEKSMIFDMNKIDDFISLCVNKILEELGNKFNIE